MKSSQPTGYVTFVLHSHLPYVVHHGTWPHGLDWLHEAAAETYLPMLRVFGELEQAGTALKANVNLSPILLEQLSHPTFQDEFPAYLQRKIDAARKDQEEFRRQGEDHFVHVAEFWQKFYGRAQSDFEALGRDIVRGFRRFYESGAIEIITCGATHGYFPLLGTDASIRAQVRTGVATHERYFGRKPRGIWLPECGYRPGGLWNYPVSTNGSGPPRGPFVREGIEQILAECGIEYFFVDTHLVETNVRFSPYQLLAGDVPIALEEESDFLDSVAGGRPVAARRVDGHGQRPADQFRPGQARRLSGQRNPDLRQLPHPEGTAGRHHGQGIFRRSLVGRASVQGDGAQHHAGQGDRHRQLHRR